MPVSIKLSEMRDAYEWLNADQYEDNRTLVSRATGKIYWRSASGDLDEEMPADLDDASLYLELPNKRDFELGSRLVFLFAREKMPQFYPEITEIFHRKGAYARLRRFLEGHDRLDSWYRYEEAAIDSALREWATEHGFTVVEVQAEGEKTGKK